MNGSALTIPVPDTRYFAAGSAYAFCSFVEQRRQKTWGGGGCSALSSLGCGPLQLLHSRAQLTNLLFQLNDMANAALTPSNLSRAAACRTINASKRHASVYKQHAVTLAYTQQSCWQAAAARSCAALQALQRASCPPPSTATGCRWLCLKQA